jgi:hypothetical protein
MQMTKETAKEVTKLTRLLTGPLLTSDERVQRELNRDPDEPPMPTWWDDDDRRNTGIVAAMQLGRTPQV